VNTGVPWPNDVGETTTAWHRVLVMQTKLHRWAAADLGRQLDDVFNLVHNPAFLMAAWDRVWDNKDGRVAGVDGIVPRFGAAGGCDRNARRSASAGEVRCVRADAGPKAEDPKGGRKTRSLRISTMTGRII